MLIKNGLVFTKDFKFEKKDILIKDGIIEKVDDFIKADNIDENHIVDALGLKVIPGLTDIHFHGCVGYDFCDGTDEAISAMAKYQLSNGVTNICPATMTLPLERLKKICSVAANHKSGEGEAVLCGINLEGPFVSPHKCGAQNPEYVHKPDVEFLQELIKDSKGLTKLVTIAPEVNGAIDCIKALKDKISFSVGHTIANYNEAKLAFDMGANHVTHLYNAMTGLNHREPGVVGAAAENERVMAEMICDGIHIHPAAIKAAFKMFGDDRIILISDSMEATGMPDGEYALGGQKVIKKGHLATLTDGTIAGSATNLMDCVRVVVQKMRIPLESAVKCAAVNSAKSVGIYDQYGSITPGKMANLVLLKEEDLSTVQVILRGQKL